MTGRDATGTRPPAIVVCDGRPAIAAVRALARQGVPVWVAGRQGGGAAASRHARGFFTLPGALAEPGAFVARLLEIGRRFDLPPVLIPCDDLTVALVTDAAGALSMSYRLAAPPPDVARAVLDKGEQYERARLAGIPLPRTWLPETPANAAAETAGIAAAASFPLVVKPRRAQAFHAVHGFKAVRVESAAGLAAVLARYPEMLVQEEVAGGIERIYEHNTYTDRSGRVVRSSTTRKRDEHPSPFGMATALEVVAAPEVEALGIRLLEAFDYRGIAHAEFKHDVESNELKLIELNPRFSWSALLQLAAGVDTIYPAYAEAAGLPLDRPTPRTRRTLWLAPERLTKAGRLLPPRRLPDSLPGPARYVSDLFDPADPRDLGPLAAELVQAATRRIGRATAALDERLLLAVHASPHGARWAAVHAGLSLAFGLWGGARRYRARLDGQEITVLCIGREKRCAPFARRLAGRLEPAGTERPRALSRPSDAAARDADLVLVEIHRWLAPRFRRAGWRIVPLEVRWRADPAELPPPRPDRHLRPDLNKVRRGGFTLEEAGTAADWAEFYETMVAATAVRRFAADAWMPTPGFRRALAAAGTLLFVRAGDDRVAGTCVLANGRSLWVPLGGVRHGDDRLRRAGAAAAQYALLFEWARRRGARQIDMGRTAPFLNDGIYRYKQKWGLRPVRDPLAGRLALWIDPRCAAAYRALEREPLLEETEHGLAVLEGR